MKRRTFLQLMGIAAPAVIVTPGLLMPTRGFGALRGEKLIGVSFDYQASHPGQMSCWFRFTRDAYGGLIATHASVDGVVWNALKMLHRPLIRNDSLIFSVER